MIPFQPITPSPFPTCTLSIPTPLPYDPPYKYLAIRSLSLRPLPCSNLVDRPLPIHFSWLDSPRSPSVIRFSNSPVPCSCVFPFKVYLILAHSVFLVRYLSPESPNLPRPESSSSRAPNKSVLRPGPIQSNPSKRTTIDFHKPQLRGPTVKVTAPLSRCRSAAAAAPPRPACVRA